MVIGRHVSGAVSALALAAFVSRAPDIPCAWLAQQDPDAKELRNPVASTPESLAAGASTYRKICAVCHGMTGNGDGKLAAATAAYGARPSDLTDDVWEHGSTDGQIFVVIRDGIGPDFNMAGWKGRLSDEDIWNVVNYVKSLGAKKK
jgi:mono/diheme cytochrome c family protein